jgi:hypothetical protein
LTVEHDTFFKEHVATKIIEHTAHDVLVPDRIYMLLHSMAHQMVHSIAERSGLDRDALGEHIYPADLAFVLYRRGMTPDLGNISAMWRNQASAFLSHMLDPRMLRCGSGSLSAPILTGPEPHRDVLQKTQGILAQALRKWAPLLDVTANQKGLGRIMARKQS